jgi:predicted secreted protein
MRRNVVRAVSARLAASLAGLILLLAPALAGDRALIDFIGYSADGKYFAFEVYGIQDGSGAAYSDIFIVDLPADKWVFGSPFSVNSFADPNPEDRPLAEVRAAARAKAAPRLETLALSQPVEILALLGDGVANADGKELGWSTPLCCGPGQTAEDAFGLALETFPIASSEDYCQELEPVGYALFYSEGDSTAELHRDGATLPRSRRCTLDYRLYAVVQPYWGAPGGRVAIVSTYPYGFEGPDRRFIAVPIDQ